MVEVVGLVALVYELTKDIYKFAADFSETPQIIKGVLLETEILAKQLKGQGSESLAEDDELGELVKELLDYSKSLRSDGKSKFRKLKDRTEQTIRSESLQAKLNSFNRRYQAQVNARIMESQSDVQKSMESQKDILDAIRKAMTEYVDGQIDIIRTEKLEALNAGILNWLSPTGNKSDKHEALIGQHHAGTGAWLYETAEFKAWEPRSNDETAAASPSEEQIQTLWLYGKRKCLFSLSMDDSLC